MRMATVWKIRIFFSDSIFFRDAHELTFYIRFDMCLDSGNFSREKSHVSDLESVLLVSIDFIVRSGVTTNFDKHLFSVLSFLCILKLSQWKQK